MSEQAPSTASIRLSLTRRRNDLDLQAVQVARPSVKFLQDRQTHLTMQFHTIDDYAGDEPEHFARHATAAA